MSYTLVVMAAGLGSRYGKLKQIEEFNGHTLLEYSVKDAHKAGFDHVVFVIQKSMQEAFQQNIEHRLPNGLRISYAYQEIPENREKPWGTGEAVLCAKPFINGPFAVINADDYYGQEAFSLLSNFFTKNKQDMCLVSYFLKNTLSLNGPVSRGICAVKEKFILDHIEEKKHIIIVNEDIQAEGVSLGKDLFVSMNCWGFLPDFLKFVEADFNLFKKENTNKPNLEYYLPNVVNKWINNKGEVHVLPTSAVWCGVTFKEDKPLLESYLKELESTNINQDLIKKNLKNSNIDHKSIYILDTVDSTNSETSRLLKKDLNVPIVVISAQQTKGRGRMNKEWTSQSKDNIYLSMGFRPDLQRIKADPLSVWVSLKIVEFLSTYTALNIQIKWPNDVLLSGKKLGGILLETIGTFDKIEELVIGVGLNINTPLDAFVLEIQNKASSIYLASGIKYNINDLATKLIILINNAYEIFIKGEFENEFQSLYKKLDALYDKKIEFEILQQKQSGIAKGIDKQGHLLVLLPNGKIQLLDSSASLSTYYS